MLACLLPQFDDVIFTRFTGNPRAADPGTLHDQAASWLEENPATDFQRRHLASEKFSDQRARGA